MTPNVISTTTYIEIADRFYNQQPYLRRKTISLFDDLSAMANDAEGGNAEQNNGADMLSALMSMSQGQEQSGAADMLSAFLGGAGEEQQQAPEGLAGILSMLSSDELTLLTNKLQGISFDAEGIQKLMADPELTETLSSKVLPLLQQLFLNRK